MGYRTDSVRNIVFTYPERMRGGGEVVLAPIAPRFIVEIKS